MNLPISQKKKKSKNPKPRPACRRCSNLSAHTGAVLAHRTAPASRHQRLGKPMKPQRTVYVSFSKESARFQQSWGHRNPLGAGQGAVPSGSPGGQALQERHGGAGGWKGRSRLSTSEMSTESSLEVRRTDTRL